MPSVPSLRGDTTRRSGCIATSFARCPAVAEVHAKLGVTYYQESKYAEAIPELQRALALKPGLPNLDALLAMSQSEVGQHAEALPGLKRAFARGGDAPLVRLVGLHLQRTYMGLGRDADAVGVALELTRRFPDDPEVLYHAGRLFSNYAYLQTMKLQRVAPDSVWMHQAAGEANESQGLWDAAIREYRRSPRRRSEPPGSALPHRSCAAGPGESARRRCVRR